MFEKIMDFYFWEVLNPAEPPQEWSPKHGNDGIIEMWKTYSDKPGLSGFYNYDPEKERFLDSLEIDRRRKRVYGKYKFALINSKEWGEFQKWKNKHG